MSTALKLEEATDDQFAYWVGSCFHDQNQKMLLKVKELLDAIKDACRGTPLGAEPVLNDQMRDLLDAVCAAQTSEDFNNREMRWLVIVECLKYCKEVHSREGTGILKAVMNVWPDVDWGQVYHILDETSSSGGPWAAVCLKDPPENKSTLVDTFMKAALAVLNEFMNQTIIETTEETRNGVTYRTFKVTGIIVPFGLDMFSTDYMSSESDDNVDIMRYIFDDQPLINFHAKEKMYTTSKEKILKFTTAADFLPVLATPLRYSAPTHLLDLLRGLSMRDFARFVYLLKADACSLTLVPIPYGSGTAPNVRAISIARARAAKRLEVLKAMSDEAKRTSEAIRIKSELKTLGAICMPLFKSFLVGKGNVFADKTIRDDPGAVLYVSDEEEEQYKSFKTQIYYIHGETWVLPIPVPIPTNSNDLADFVKDLTDFFVEHRPGVMSKDEADQLVDQFRV